MKKTIALISLLVLMLWLVGCNKKQSKILNRLWRHYWSDIDLEAVAVEESELPK